jgi:multiple sugar transport system substrate-binding protein
MFKQLIFSSVVIIFLFTLVSCSGKRIEKASGSIAYVSYLDSAGSIEPEASTINAFEKKYPEATIARRPLKPADVQNHGVSYIESSQAPDVMTWIINGKEDSLFREEKIADLTKLWKNNDWITKYPQAVVSASSIENRFFLLPYSADIWQIFYNKVLFDSLELSIPKTWQEFVAVCERLKEKSITPITVGARYRWPAAVWFEYINVRLNGSEFHRLIIEGRESFTDGRIVNAFELLVQIINAGFFVENAISLAWAEAMGPLLDGKAAMYLMNTSLLTALPEERKDEFASFHFPIIESSVPPSAIGVVEGWIAPSNGQNKRAAELFLSFLGSAEGQTVLSTVEGVSVVQQGIASGNTDAIFTIPEEADIILPSLIRAAPPVLRQAFYDSIRSIWLDPSNSTIDQVISDLEKARGEL